MVSSLKDTKIARVKSHHSFIHNHLRISVGSGIEHAEGGGDSPGSTMMGFQIWINVPAAKKMDDPRYGTVPTENLPLTSFGEGPVAMLLLYS